MVGHRVGGVLSTPNNNRFSRQSGLVPRAGLLTKTVSVIGVGAIGRQVALQLASIGVPKLQLIDFDTVDETNLCTQGYRSRDLGTAKVTATAFAVKDVDEAIEIEVVVDRFRPSQTIGNIAFVCVDSISARSAIWRSLRSRVEVLIDTRMSGETLRLLTWQRGDPFDHYEESLFPQSEAHAGACTSKSTIYSASIAAGFAVHQLTRTLREIPMDADILINLLAGEMTISPASSIQGEHH